MVLTETAGPPRKLVMRKVLLPPSQQFPDVMDHVAAKCWNLLCFQFYASKMLIVKKKKKETFKTGFFTNEFSNYVLIVNMTIFLKTKLLPTGSS